MDRSLQRVSEDHTALARRNLETSGMMTPGMLDPWHLPSSWKMLAECSVANTGRLPLLSLQHLAFVIFLLAFQFPLLSGTAITLGTSELAWGKADANVPLHA